MRPIDDVKNWMTMFRWIVKLIRDEYGIEESRLTRHAQLESELGLSIEQVEEMLQIIAGSFTIRFPDGTLNEVLKLEELCMLASWLKGLYKHPEFLSDGFTATCRAQNPAAMAA
ncbi:acyl carrier protein [Acetobacteraceae bacterium H6797]|nr:acyl carrier protein [Acetobacteraceae bacterium H6797]